MSDGRLVCAMSVWDTETNIRYFQCVDYLKA